MLLHRPEVYEPGQQEGIADVDVAKQRNGPSDVITLTFEKNYMRFGNYAAGVIR